MTRNHETEHGTRKCIKQGNQEITRMWDRHGKCFSIFDVCVCLVCIDHEWECVCELECERTVLWKSLWPPFDSLFSEGCNDNLYLFLVSLLRYNL